MAQLALGSGRCGEMLRPLQLGVEATRFHPRGSRLERQFTNGFDKFCLQSRPGHLPRSGDLPLGPGQVGLGGQVAGLSEVEVREPTAGVPLPPATGALPGSENDPLPECVDPLALVLSSPPLSGTPLSGVMPGEVSPRADFVVAVEELVRRISWGGERGSGSARIELGGGKLRGAIVVHTEGRTVSVELSLPGQVDGEGLARRLRERLEARGLNVAALELR